MHQTLDRKSGLGKFKGRVTNGKLGAARELGFLCRRDTT